MRAQTAMLHAHVGYGTLGTGGALGYDGKRVVVGGVECAAALSTHPPARVLYHVGGAAREFRARVALNDDVPPGASHADFAVCADGREVATVLGVSSGHEPRELVADVTGAQLVELVVTTTAWSDCHAVWLNPSFDATASSPAVAPLRDPLGTAEIEPLPPLEPAERCIVTVASEGFEVMLDDLLGSILANGEVNDARLVVFVLGESPGCDRVIAKYRAIPVRCAPLRAPDRGSKAVLYAAARVVAAERYLCIDADVVVLGSLAAVFAAIDACPPGRILACREGNDRHFRDLDHVVCEAYGGRAGDVARITGDASLGAYRLVVNDGVFAGDPSALVALDGAIRGMPGATAWLDGARQIPWRNQAIFNLALARLDCGVELDGRFNVQLHASSVEVSPGRPVERVTWSGRPVVGLHASATGRHRHPELQGRFAAVADPLVGAGDGDLFAAFMRALRAWVGIHGTAALAWSFYGFKDGSGGRVRDPSTFPMLACLHYLVRANGAISVLETGTARGVSAACLASAVAHRSSARVVSLDPLVLAEREALWELLPAAMRQCIDARRIDSLTEMARLIEAGDRFDVAMLDSEYTERQLYAELELAEQLVVPGGLILAHDSRWAPGVARALDRFEAAGHPAVRLWAAAAGELEDAGLGLAVIANGRAADD